MDLLTSARALRGWAAASLVANMAIVWTGALVRLTGSGLGCATWPQCEPGSYTPLPESGVHGLIEFGNRLLTFVLVAIAIGTAITALRLVRRGRAPRATLWLAVGIGLGIVAQAVIGGLSVLAQLNPWVVGLHMVASVVLILLCLELVRRAWGVERVPAPARLHALTSVVFWLGVVVIVLGVVVTGSGPHAGDGAATRNGFSPEWTAKLHAWSVWAVVGLTALGVRWARADARLRRAWVALLGVELLQGLVGYVQYFTALPIGLVLAHMVGTTLFAVALGHLWLVTARGRPDQSSSGSSAAAMKTTAR